METGDGLYAWRPSWRSPAFRKQLLFSLLILALLPFFFNRYFAFIESRPGVVLDDPVLSLISPADVSFAVFIFLYGGIFLSLIYLLLRPSFFLAALQTYLVATFFRIISLLIVPLEPPAGYLPLREPFVQLFTPGGTIISKDLFFSGHVLTLTVLFLSVRNKWIRMTLVVCTIAVAASLLVQHNHYLVDILFALPAAWLAQRIVLRFSGAPEVRIN